MNKYIKKSMLAWIFPERTRAHTELTPKCTMFPQTKGHLNEKQHKYTVNLTPSSLLQCLAEQAFQVESWHFPGGPELSNITKSNFWRVSYRLYVSSRRWFCQVGAELLHWPLKHSRLTLPKPKHQYTINTPMFSQGQVWSCFLRYHTQKILTV